MLRLVLFLFIHSSNPHGFGEHTLVAREDHQGHVLIREVASWAADGDKPIVVTCDPDRNISWTTRRATKGCYGTTHCYVSLKFNTPGSQTVLCTPTQLFYRIRDKQWVAACMLDVGDQLLCKTGYTTELIEYSFIEQPLKVFTFEVEDTHIFLVGEQGIVAHNMMVPVAAFIGVVVPFDLCAAGGLAGLVTIGGVGLVGGLGIGALVGVAVTLCRNPFRKHTFSYDAHALGMFRSSKARNAYSKETSKYRGGGLLGSPMPDPDDENEENGREEKLQQRPLTNKEAREQASKMGYEEAKDAPFNNHGGLTFRRNNTYISVDRDCHKGGVWKMLDRSGKRTGTWNIDLTKMVDG